MTLYDDLGVRRVLNADARLTRGEVAEARRLVERCVLAQPCKCRRRAHGAEGCPWVTPWHR